MVHIFDDWQNSKNTFNQDIDLELRAAGKGYIDSYLEYEMRIYNGDYNAMMDSPIMSTIVESMLRCFPKEFPPKNRLQEIAKFFISEHFARVPKQSISARIYASLKDMVKRGAYSNREQALVRLSGFFYDVNHISTYAPYCDAIIVDKPMAELISDKQVSLDNKYGVKIFSLNNWEDLFNWLDEVENEMTEDHKNGLAAVYPD